jgi:hypothetical protein
MVRKIGLTPRREEKIKPFEDLLVIQSDAEVGRRANVDTEIVRLYRFAHGFLKPGESVPAAEDEAEAPVRASKAPPAEQKPRRGGPTSALDAYLHLLGTMSDRDVARRAEVTPAAVAQYRRRRGIGSFAASKNEETPAPTLNSRQGGSSLDDHLHLVGTRPDAEVAKIAGLSRSAVTQYRKRRGITAFAPKVARDEAQPVAAPPREAPRAPVVREAPEPTVARATASHRAVSFIVKVRRGEIEADYLVVGPDLAAAAAQAVQAVSETGDVLSITRHMDALI